MPPAQFPANSLFEMVTGMKAQQLCAIARSLSIKGASKMRKARLVDAVIPQLLLKENMRQAFDYISGSSWELVQCIAGSEIPVPIMDSSILVECEALSEQGYLQISRIADGCMAYMPPELREIFQSIDTEDLRQRKIRYDSLNAYAMASVNLYGLISLDELTDIFNRQNDDKTNADELRSVLSRHNVDTVSYRLYKEYVVSDVFEENNFLDAQDLLAIIEGKPRFIPERDLFLKYADPDFIEWSNELTALENFLKANTFIFPPDIKDIAAKIHFSCTTGGRLKSILEIVGEYNVSFSQRNLVQLTSHGASIANNTRKWTLKGFTQNELQNLEKKRLPTRKVGRNEPCPCGSGKKFKRCCGR